MTADSRPTEIGVCTVSLVAEPMRPEYPWRVRCSACGWVDHFDTQSTATLWALRHDEATPVTAGNQSRNVRLVADEVAHLVEDRDIAERIARRILTVLAEADGEATCGSTWREYVHGQTYTCTLSDGHSEDHQATVRWERRP